ncbi:MAG TPA: D-allulose-6-phosphate 3-epimerase [Citreicella sp.]|nr:D-allulose-6-phosphate 3-epimerase [Citreicella sp.]
MTLFLDTLPRTRLLAEISLWSADLLNLERDMARIAPYGDILHVDVADARFTPGFLFFPDLVARIADVAQAPVHVHLMTRGDIVVDQARQFAEAGADLVTVHAETGAEGLAALDLLAARGTAGGVALTLDQPLAALEPFLPRVAMVTLMGTRIGIKGAGLDPEAVPRIRALRQTLAAQGLGRVRVAADGGIRDTTVPDLRAAGADTVVMGSLAFGADDLAARFGWLRGLGAQQA